MDRDRATHEAYDGVRLELLNGAVAECAPLTVQEAVRYLRHLRDVREGRPAALDAFLAEFPERVGLDGQKLRDLGLEVEGVAFGDLTCADGRQILETFATATGHPDETARSRAQIAILDTAPRLLGLATAVPAEVFAAVRSVVDAFLALIFGLAEDFCSTLTASPPVRVLRLRAPSRPSASTT